MSECLGDARYTKSVYALLSRFIVWSLLCYCVRDNDHCCVLCDVTRDLLFAKYIVHQPNVYQYGALIYPASVRQGLDYLPVNSKTSYPPGIPRAFFRTVGNLTQNLRPDLSGIDFRVKMLVSLSFSVYITFKYYWRHCSYIHCFVGALRAYEATYKRTQHCWSNIVGQRLPILRSFARSLKEPVKCRLFEMNDVIGMNKSPWDSFPRLEIFRLCYVEIKIWI